MDERRIDDLIEELESYRKQRKELDAIVKQIGGRGSAKRTKVLNILFIVALTVLFSLDVLRHFVEFAYIPENLSLQVGVLMISLKIIWFAHKRNQVEHFQFWIMNSLEMRINMILDEMKSINKQEKQPSASLR